MSQTKPGMRMVAAAIAVSLAAAQPASANNLGENFGWQFRTSADQIAQTAILDVITKRKYGYYASPVYTTTVEHQYNCTVSAVATGNSGMQSAVANSATVNGASSHATGNSGQTELAGPAGSASTSQSNAGSVAANIAGGTFGYTSGTASQVLNSDQTNNAAQQAKVNGSEACAFGALN